MCTLHTCLLNIRAVKFEYVKVSRCLLEKIGCVASMEMHTVFVEGG